MVYTKIRDKPVNKLIEKTFAQDVPTEVDRYIERDNIVEIKEQVAVTDKEIVEILLPGEKEYINVVEEKIHTVDRVMERIVEKIVERITELPVNIIQEKLVKEIDYQIIK